MDISKIKTFQDLKISGYVPKTIKQEMKNNLRNSLQHKIPLFKTIIGYENSVIPQIERAILAGHNINFLGLRGQAKTKMARLMIQLLDEYIPIIAGSEINDDPFNPLSAYGRKKINEMGDQTPIEFIHREQRYTEKLATPDVNIADLIGDVDPIKAANLKLSYAHEEVIHFGLIPRSNRGIFVINELPDLQARIQVALLNILQEGDIQIRGFQFRFPLDIQFVFTANPEDYTSRGAIITPLKDRIQSQIFTHYPEDIEISKTITKQEIHITDTQKYIHVPELIEDLIEQVTFEARESEYVDPKSGVSARLAISAYESMLSAVERRNILNKETKGNARIADLNAIIPAIVGKIEMVYEGEQEGAEVVAYKLIQNAVLSLATDFVPELENHKTKATGELKKKYKNILTWFEAGNFIDLVNDDAEKNFNKQLEKVDGLQEAVKAFDINKSDTYLYMELLLNVLSIYGLVDKKIISGNTRFQDYLSSVLKGYE